MKTIWSVGIKYDPTMGLFRARLTSFFLGFGLASGLAIYQLRQDVSQSHVEIIESASAVFASDWRIVGIGARGSILTPCDCRPISTEKG